MADLWKPKLGERLQVRFAKDDELLLIWLADKHLPRGQVSDFIRSLLHAEMRREMNPLAAIDQQALAAGIAKHLAPLLSQITPTSRREEEKAGNAAFGFIDDLTGG